LRATPVFCDIDAATWCLDPESAARGLSPRTKAMIVVDLYGNMPRMDELLALAQSHNIPVLEDAANAVGSTYKGVRAGKFGLVSVFSFHRTKTIVTGEGGMLLTDDEQLFERCRVLRDHGRRPGGPPYYNYEVAYKYMPFNLQAAMGHAQFQRLEELVGRKRSLLQQYRDLLADIPDIQLNPEPPDGVNGAWVTALVFGRSHRLTKAEAMRRLTELGLPTRPFFYPLTAMPAYAAAGAGRAPNAVAHDISDRGIILPAAPILTEAQLSRYCDGIKKIIGL
jgi:perosamine synthetase